MCARHLQGEHVRLVALKSDMDVDVLARWSAMSESWRLLDAVGVRPAQSAANDGVGFLIYPLAGDRAIGHAGLFGIDWTRGEAWLGIGLGDHEHWSTRVGLDALRTVLGYSFDELNLRRVLLGVFDYNARALRMYESVGFAIEGRMLQEASRSGRSRAGVYMSLRREEWELPTEHATRNT